MSLFRNLTLSSLAFVLSGFVGLGVLGVLTPGLALADGLNDAGPSAGVVQGVSVGPRTAGHMAVPGKDTSAESQQGSPCSSGCGSRSSTNTATTSLGVVQGVTVAPRTAVQAALLGKNTIANAPGGSGCTSSCSSGGSSPSNTATKSVGVAQGVHISPQTAVQAGVLGKNAGSNAQAGGNGGGSNAATKSLGVVQGVDVSPQTAVHVAILGTNASTSSRQSRGCSPGCGPGADTSSRTGCGCAGRDRGSSNSAKTLVGVIQGISINSQTAVQMATPGTRTSGTTSSARSGTASHGAAKSVGVVHTVSVNLKTPLPVAVLGKYAGTNILGEPDCDCSTPPDGAHTSILVPLGSSAAPQTAPQRSVLGASAGGTAPEHGQVGEPGFGIGATHGSRPAGGSSGGGSSCGARCSVTAGPGGNGSRGGSTSSTSSGDGSGCSPVCAVGSVTDEAVPLSGGVVMSAPGTRPHGPASFDASMVLGATLAPAVATPTESAGSSPAGSPPTPELGATAVGVSLGSLASRLGGPIAATLRALSAGPGWRAAPAPAAPGRLPPMGGGYGGRRPLDDLAELLVLLAAAACPRRVRALVR